MKLLSWLFVAFGVLAAGMNGSASAKPEGIQVTPVIVDMPIERGMTSLRIHNWRAQDVAFETEILSWSQKNGDDELTPTPDIVVSPSVFSVPADGDQIVRLALKPGVRGVAAERAFRLLLREISAAESAENELRVQLQLSLPVFAGPKTAAPRLDVKPSSGDITLTNSGTSRVRLISAAADGQPLQAGLPKYLLPGSSAVLTRPQKSSALYVQYLSRDASGPVSEKFAIHAPNASPGVR